MDRAAFLSSLPYLRPLPPTLWDKCLAEPTSSCSTATPPTPRSEMDSLLLDDVVVSIEPIHKSYANKKRDRNDDCGQPAFFLCKKVMAETSSNVSTAKTTESNEEHAPICNEKINNDPAICSFEIAIVKRKQILSCLGCEKDVLTTPSKTDMDVDNSQSQSQSEIQSPMVPHNSLDSNVLIFRFGRYFVFEVNASAITSIKHQAGEERKGDDEKEHDGVESPEGGNIQQSKRQRIEDGKSEKADGVKHPSCLCISFPSCTFRLFTIEKNQSNGDRQFDSSHILETKSKIMRHVDIDNTLTWAPIPSETIHTDDWLCCLDHIIKEKEKTSPVKTDSSSTHFEKGQKHTSEIRADDNEDEEGAKSSVLNSETQPIDSIDRIFNEKHSNKSSSQIHEESVMAESINSKQSESAIDQDDTFRHQVSTKRRAFDSSWSHLQESCDTGKSSSLTSCAHSLARSYCNSKQLSSIAMHCDSNIDATTNKIQDLIESLMPARGRSSDNKVLAPLTTDIDTEKRINDLLRSRKEAVSAKYASLLIPKK